MLGSVPVGIEKTKFYISAYFRFSRLSSGINSRKKEGPMSKETLRQRLPAAIRRIGNFLGSDQSSQLNDGFRMDLKAIHAAAADAAKHLKQWKTKEDSEKARGE
jgi:hypothetical protein